MATDTEDVHATFCALHARYEGWIRKYLSRLVGDVDAEDLSQDVFVRALGALAAREGRPVNVAAWLYRTATHVAVDWQRSRAVRERVYVAADLRDLADMEGARPDHELDRAKMKACIAGMVERLPPAHRGVLLFAELRGLTDRETAEALGVTLGAAKIRLHRARRALLDLMQRECRTFRDHRNEFACEPTRVGRPATRPSRSRAKPPAPPPTPERGQPRKGRRRITRAPR